MRNRTKNSEALALSRDAPASDGLELTLPDWSGKAQHKTRMTFAEAVEWNEEVVALFFSKVGAWLKQGKGAVRC